MILARPLAFLLSVSACSGWQAARDTLAVEFSMSHLDGLSQPTFREGEMVSVEFHIKDKASGSNLSAKYPTAWIDSRGNADPAHPVTCKQRVQRLLNADAFSRPEVDLNTYYVMAMNNDASITVVDPEFGYGNTRLLALVPLRSPGTDWALTAGSHPVLFVSMAASQKLAVIDTSSWRVVREVDIAEGAGRIALQPDGKYLWIATEAGVLTVDTGTFQVAAQLKTGAGPHNFAFTPDARLVFVTNPASGTVSILDTGTLKLLREVHAGPNPTAIAYSAQSRKAYTIDNISGNISVIDGESDKFSATVHVAPGLNAIRFARNGRFGFVLNRLEKRIYILDSSTNRVIQSTSIEHEPDQVTFSDTVAYIRQVDNDAVLMVPLDAIGVEGKTIPVADFTGGQHPPGQAGHTAAADGIVRAPGENAVLVANPADKAIYYYSEGMAAPMGFFSNYSREPKAILVLDRSLREAAPGIYRTTSHLPKPGRYTMAFLLDAPPAVQCWDFEVQPDPARPENSKDRSEVESLNPGVVPSGTAVSLRFRLLSSVTSQPKPGAPDLIIQAYLLPGMSQQRVLAKPVGDGVYEAGFVFAEPGEYRVHLMSASLGLSLRDFSLKLIVAPK